MTCLRWPQRYTVVVLLMLAALVAYADRTVMSVAIVPMSAELGWDKAQEGTILAAFFVGYLLTQLVAGLLADKFGAKLILGSAACAWSILTVFTPLAARGGGLATLVAVRLAVGAAQAATFPCILSMQAVWIPLAERNLALSISMSGMLPGAAIAMGATPTIITAFGWPAAFVGFGCVGLRVS